MKEAPSRVGSIRFEEVLGQGAMGTVWAGVDEKLRRDVAVKTLRSNQVSLETRARLLTEARILSQLEAPGICRVYDYLEGGKDGDYLVLERIRGRTLREVVTENGGKADRSAVLRIGEELAEALAAAHGRGVIHRDLKPSNVMLAKDEHGVERVKVLDFGIARTVAEAKSATPSETSGNGDVRRAAADGTLTRFGSLLAAEDGDGITGTPAYMSPEQARGEAASAASDIYSLALTLQELATGRPAYPSDLPLSELVSKVIAGSTQPVHDVDGNLRALIEDMKAMDPNQRPTAREAVRRFQRIRDRPRRVRQAVVIVALAVVAVISGVKYTVDLQRERNRALAAESEAVAAEKEAVASAAEAASVADFLTSLFEAADPYRQEDLTIRDFLDRGAAEADRLSDRPIVHGRILHTIGTMYNRLVLPEEAAVHLERALELRRRTLGDLHPNTAATLNEIGRARMYQSNLAAAEKAYQEVLAIQRQERSDHPDTPRTLRRLGQIVEFRDPDTAVGMYREALAILQRSQGDPNVEHSATLSMLALFQSSYGDIGEAEKLFRESIEISRHLGRSHVAIDADLAKVLTIRGQLVEAEEMFRASMEVTRPAWGERSVPMAVLAARLAEVKREQGDLAAADRLLQEALAIAAEHQSEDRDLFGYFYTKVARLRAAQGDLEAAVAVSEKASRIMESTVGGPVLIEARVQWADFLRQTGDLERAEAVITSVFNQIQGRETLYWMSHVAQSVRGAIWSEQGRREEAEPLLVQGLDGLRESCSDRSSWTRLAQERLIEHYEAVGQMELAEKTRALIRRP